MADDNPSKEEATAAVAVEESTTAAPEGPKVVDPVESEESEDIDDTVKKDDSVVPAKKVGGIEGDRNEDLPDFEFPLKEVCFPLFGGTVRFNPVTSAFAGIVLWGLTIWCMVDPEGSKAALAQARLRVTELFTWFYIGTNPFFMFFMIWLAVKYGHIRLGPKNSEPEFNDVTYFAMLFSAGIGVGLFFYGVSEPLYHQTDNWFAESNYRTQDEVDMFALNLTVFHWGITGWSQYLVVAVCAGLASFRFKLPMSLRSCFFPLLGDHTWGWIGDIIDGFTIVTTVAGVCTSLGLGCFQISAGLARVGAIEDDLADEDLQRVHVITIWIITLIATCSVVSGLSVGIKYLSQLGFGLGMLLLLVVFILDKTNYLLNLIVQEIGYYFQWSIFLLNFHTDAFGQLREGEGRAVDDQAAAVWWMDAWTIFYIGWWVSWGAFVGLFISRISYGRTIRSVIAYSYIAPLGYTMVWFGIFGGVGLRQSRQALELQDLGTEYYEDPNTFLQDGSYNCYDVPQEDIVIDGETVFTNYLPGVTPVCTFNSTYYDQAWYNVLNSFSYPLDVTYGFGPFLTWLSLFAVGVYFITSSDSGSLIVDNLASNGNDDTHTLQRVFWACTEGAVATGLLVAGGDDALRALQSASIVSGLPFTLLLCLMCSSIIDMCKLAESNNKEGKEVSLQDEYLTRRVFKLPVFGGVFDVFEHLFSCCCFMKVDPERAQASPRPQMDDYVAFLVASVFPFLPLYNIYKFLYPKESDKRSNIIMTAIYSCFFYLWIALFASLKTTRGIRAFAWSSLLICGLMLCNARTTLRTRFGIRGNLVADFAYGSLMWPQVLLQMVHEIEENPDKDDVNV